MSQLTQRVKKLEEAQPQLQERRIAVAIPQQGETTDQAVARVRASHPGCRKVLAVKFVEASHRVSAPAVAGNDHAAR